MGKDEANEVRALTINLSLVDTMRKCDESIYYLKQSKAARRKGKKAVDYFEIAKGRLLLTLLQRIP